MKELDKLNILKSFEVLDNALAVALRANDFLLNGQITFAHRAIGNIGLAGDSFSEHCVLVNRVVKLIESGNTLHAANAMKSLIDVIKRHKKDAFDAIRKIIIEQP